MGFRIHIHFEARKETTSSIDWYEIRSEGRGKDFYESVEKTIRRILENPNQFPPFNENLKKAKVAGYPYNVFFFEVNELVFIQAVLHHKRSYKKMLKRKF